MQLQAEFLEGFQRQEEAVLFAGKCTKPITLVKRRCAIVLGIDDDGMDCKGRARPDNTADGVEQKLFAKPAPLLFAIDSKATQDCGWHGVMGQPFRQRRRQFVFFEARGAQAVVAGNFPEGVAKRHEHLGHAPTDVLGCLPPKVEIESRFPAREGRTVMVRSERLDDQDKLIHRRARDSGARLPSASCSAPAG